MSKKRNFIYEFLGFLYPSSKTSKLLLSMNYTLVEVEKRGPLSPAGVGGLRRLPVRVPAHKPLQRGPHPSAGSAALHFPRPSGQSSVSLRHRHMHPTLSAHLSIKSTQRLMHTHPTQMHQTSKETDQTDKQALVQCRDKYFVFFLYKIHTRIFLKVYLVLLRNMRWCIQVVNCFCLFYL